MIEKIRQGLARPRDMLPGNTEESTPDGKYLIILRIEPIWEADK
jgi:hypothetical protein